MNMSRRFRTYSQKKISVDHRNQQEKRNMKLFINDIPMCFVSKNAAGSAHGFNSVFNQDEPVNKKLLTGNVLFKNPSHQQIDEFLELMGQETFDRLCMVTLSCNSKKKLVEYLKSKFTIIEAGGGIVERKKKYLMIFRKGQWDIPKGKMEEGETPKECAHREVEEETCVKVKVGKKIGSIWHTYMQKQQFILKKTHWYTMTCLDDSEMEPQKIERITEVKWMTMQEMQESLVDSYKSLQYLTHRFKEQAVKV